MKPANLLVAADLETVKLGDFGVRARARGSRARCKRRGREGGWAGLACVGDSHVEAQADEVYR